MLETEHAQDATFRENFFRDFRKVLDEHPPVSLLSSLTVFPLTGHLERGCQGPDTGQVRFQTDAGAF